MRIRSIGSLAAAVRGRRQELRLSQAELAVRASVSRKWVYEFEAGKPTAELGLILRVLDALGLALELTDESEDPRKTSDLDHLIEEHRSR